jgi:hypothetical protein
MKNLWAIACVIVGQSTHKGDRYSRKFELLSRAQFGLQIIRALAFNVLA